MKRLCILILIFSSSLFLRVDALENEKIDLILKRAHRKFSTNRGWSEKDLILLEKVRKVLLKRKDYKRLIKRAQILARFTDNIEKFNRSIIIRKDILKEYASKLKDKDILIRANIQLANSYLYNSDIKNATKYFKEGLRLCQKRKSNVARLYGVIACGNLLGIYQAKLNIKKADYYSSLLEKQVKGLDKISLSFICKDEDLFLLLKTFAQLGDMFRTQGTVAFLKGNKKKAAVFYGKMKKYFNLIALKLNKSNFFIKGRMDRLRVIAYSFHNSGFLWDVEWNLEEYKRETSQILEVYKILKDFSIKDAVVEDMVILQRALLEIADGLSIASKNYKNSPDKFLKIKKITVNSYHLAIKAMENYGYNSRIVNAYISLAAYYIYYYDLNDKDNCKIIEEYLNKAYTYNKKRSKNPFTLIEYYIVKGEYAQRRGDLKNARDSYLKAIKASEEIITFIAENEEEKVKLLQQMEFLYKKTSQLLIKTGNPKGAFEVMERFKGAQFVGNIDISRIKTKNPQLQKALKVVGVLKSKASKTEKALQKENNKPIISRNLNRINHLTKTLASTKSEFFKNINTIRKLNPEYEKLVAVKPVRFARMQRLIPDDTIIVQYLPTKEKLYVFLVTNDSFKIKSVKFNAQLIKKNVIKFRHSMDDVANSFMRGNITVNFEKQKNNNVLKSLFNLYNILIKPIEKDISSKEVVAFIPTGILYYLPFQALAKRSSQGGLTFFIEEKRVVYLTNGNLDFFIHKKENKMREGIIQAFSNPDGTLISADMETNKIKELFPKAIIYKGNDATKEKIKDSPQNMVILHLATHGVLNGKDVNESYIVTAGKGENGKLKQGEIFELPLENTSLVTLSACQTALGERAPGSEIASLAMAFSIAGASSIVATLWSISDESTSVLMREFYVNLKKGKNKGESLRNAQLKLIKSKKCSHPFYWAAFVLIGDWR